MLMTDTELALVLRGRRLVSDEVSDQYFDFVTHEIKNGGNVFNAVRTGVQLFGMKHGKFCPGCN
jgi:hypothetical protein